MSEPKKIWFRAKSFGWGWVPATWQGWMVVAAYAVFVTAATSFVTKRAGAGLMGRPEILGFIAAVIFATVILILVCYLKGERPRWRSGRREENNSV